MGWGRAPQEEDGRSEGARGRCDVVVVLELCLVGGSLDPLAAPASHSCIIGGLAASGASLPHHLEARRNGAWDRGWFAHKRELCSYMGHEDTRRQIWEPFSERAVRSLWR